MTERLWSEDLALQPGERRGVLCLKPVSPPIEVYALASGSSGNATLVRMGDRYLLIDAGLPLKALTTALSKRGVGEENLEAILLTHEHSDHSSSAGAVARRYRAPIYANAATLAAYQEREGVPFRFCLLDTGATAGIGPFGVRSFPVPHDAADPVGFVLEAGSVRISYCTDVGTVTAEVRGALQEANLAIVEANHDLDMLRRGPYTPLMKERVASTTGHLSNSDCAELIAERVAQGGALSVWLAHLSRVNNTPSLALRTVQRIVGQKTDAPYRVQVALRDHPSLIWRSGEHSVQLALL